MTFISVTIAPGLDARNLEFFWAAEKALDAAFAPFELKRTMSTKTGEYVRLTYRKASQYAGPQLADSTPDASG